MKERQKLIQAFRSGTLVKPSARIPNLISLAMALGMICKSRLAKRSKAATAIAKQIGTPKRLVFVLVDGLGTDVVQNLPSTSFLKSHLRQTLRTVFPATTSAALNSLATGTWPGSHGVTNWFLYLREIKASVRSLPYDERFRGTPLSKLDLKPAQLFALPTLFPTFKRQVIAVMPKAIASSVFTNYTVGKPHSPGYSSLGNAFRTVEKILRAQEDSQFIYLYLPQLDDLSHRFGKSHPHTKKFLAALDASLWKLRHSQTSNTRIVLTADHGFRDIGRDNKFSVSHAPRLASMLRVPPTGDSRMILFHVKKNRLKAFADEFSSLFGEHFCLLNQAELEELGLLGPQPWRPSTRQRLGDYIAIALDDSVLKLEIDEKLVGAHSGLSPAEMNIPLIIG